MKIHVMIATTTSVVAVQELTDLEDMELLSFFSLRGTCQTLPLSNEYHNLVKKGPGIIQKHFGGTSYRADISAEIHQGNSWQLGLYVAHAVRALNLLGDGENIASADHVIIASGELNTSKETVNGVSQIPIKMKHIQAFSDDLTIQPESLTVLLSQDNRNDCPATSSLDTIFLQSLFEVSGVLRNLVKVTPEESVTHSEDKSNQILASEPKQTGRLLRNVTLGSLAVLLVGLLSWRLADMSDNVDLGTEERGQSGQGVSVTKEVSNPALLAEKQNAIDRTIIGKHASVADVEEMSEQQSIHRRVENTKRSLVPMPTMAVRVSHVLTELDDFKPDCGGPSEIKSVELQHGKFESVPFTGLCSIRLDTVNKIKEVIILAPDTGYMGYAELSYESDSMKRFAIQVPQQRGHDLTYAIVVSKMPVNSEGAEKFKGCLSDKTVNLPVDIKQLELCIAAHEKDTLLLTHTLNY